MLRIAVDGMGGDYAPQAIVEGACQAANDFDYEIILVGRENALKRELNRHRVFGGKIFIHNANDIVAMDETPVAALKKKKDSSISVCLDLLKKGEVDAVVSAGNTGAAVAAATLKIGLLSGVSRPGIAITLPTLKGPTLIIDGGANITPRPEHLVEYAVMGSIYSRYIHKKNNPSVGLLNIGEEETKGTDVYKETYQILRDTDLNFIGNIEGRDIFTGRSDCVVCDGFVGNVLLKVVESLADSARTLIRREIKKNFLAKIGALCLKSSLAEIKRDTDYTEHGGAPLLGINGVVIISHGGSNAKAIRNAIHTAADAVDADVNGQIIKELETQEDTPGDAKEE